MLEELKNAVNALANLLNDPKPELINWSESVVTRMKRVRRIINEILGDEPNEDCP